MLISRCRVRDSLCVTFKASSLIFFKVGDPSGITGLVRPVWFQARAHTVLTRPATTGRTGVSCLARELEYSVEKADIVDADLALVAVRRAALPAFFVMAQVYFLPESPRWLIGRGRYREAFNSLCRLRHTKLQAARDLFLINALLEEEANMPTGKAAFFELFNVARNRRATLASGVVMCVLWPSASSPPGPTDRSTVTGSCSNSAVSTSSVRLPPFRRARRAWTDLPFFRAAYYSATIFREAGFDDVSALGATLGFGALKYAETPSTSSSRLADDLLQLGHGRSCRLDHRQCVITLTINLLRTSC